MKLPEQHHEKAEWMNTTCNHALFAIVDVFTQYYEVLGPLLMDDLFTQLQWCFQQDHEQLARSGTHCFEHLIISTGSKFSPAAWNSASNFIKVVFQSTQPDILLTWKPSNDQGQLPAVGNVPNAANEQSNPRSKVKGKPSNNAAPKSEHDILFGKLLIKCIVQLELITTVDNIVFFPSTSRKEDAENLAAAQTGAAVRTSQCEQQREEQGMYPFLSSEHLFIILDSLEGAHNFAKTFNLDNEQRNLLWKAGFKGQIKPNLIQQECQSLATTLRILFRMYLDESMVSSHDDIEKRLIVTCRGALEYFILLPSNAHRDTWTNLVLLCLTKVLKLPDDRFKIHSMHYYPYLCELICIDLKAELKAVLKKYFSRVGPIFGICAHSTLNSQSPCQTPQTPSGNPSLSSIGSTGTN
jgi:brefeldin A-inhibited guanine nucleotide-exchange protein